MKNTILVFLLILIIFILYQKNKYYFSYIPKNKKDVSLKDKVKFNRNLAKELLTNKAQLDNVGLCAGEVYYKDLWARDAFFGCLGLLSIDETIQVKQVISTLKKYQREDGLIPLRVGSNYYTLRFLLGVDLPGISAVYTDDKANQEPTDSNSQYIILNQLYYQKTLDLEFLKSNYNSCKKAFVNLTSKLKEDLLIHGKYFDTWHDTFAINGASLFSNVFYLKAYRSMIFIEETLHVLNDKDIDVYKKNYLLFEENFEKVYWNGSYLRMYPNMDYFETAGNSLAILFDIVSNDKGIKILDYLDNNNPTEMVPVSIPQLPDKYIYNLLYLINLQGYHNEHIWPWVFGLTIAAANHINYQSKKLELGLEKLTETYYKYENYYERLDRETLEPVKHFFQSTEINFSESAGMYLLATNNK